ncbi:hypothetical protein AK812_SmicGene22124 [Symbiodinium microadriaticum]|uniref:Uncharacterized protein n=1 Tax=Symbiodinium microadriaticum TaxID=2951 RepID=A0A1Q9DKN0_SYMMI|nr:hypothetical protein AK812_SmicGene22124 [Symbiodinium microadriaticum]
MGSRGAEREAAYASVEQLEQKNAEAKKRAETPDLREFSSESTASDRDTQGLEETEANAEGQLKWLRSELDTRSDELSKANQQLSLTKADKASFFFVPEKMTAHLKEVSDALQSSKQELSKAQAEASPRLPALLELSVLAMTRLEAAPTAETLPVAAAAAAPAGQLKEPMPRS